MLAKNNRLTKDRDFKRVWAKGNTFKGNFIYIKFNQNTTNQNRFGVVISKKNVAHAVDRNKVKRRMRYIIQKHIDNVPSKLDIIINFSNNIMQASYKDLENDYLGFVRRIN
ncbi:MAG: hypothetical protein ACD_58C00317G0009 [uncultured bacterium]|nr:MAG: hypothetical protein ACD_58C00317G0009 [uncultured bacterium]